VIRWNAILMSAPTESAKDVLEMLSTLEASDDIVIQEGTNTFSSQSTYSKKFIFHGSNKLYFQVIGGLLYLM
jgi:6-phosphogluconate dehydrogenase (decarboxylating)